MVSPPASPDLLPPSYREIKTLFVQMKVELLSCVLEKSRSLRHCCIRGFKEHLQDSLSLSQICFILFDFIFRQDLKSGVKITSSSLCVSDMLATNQPSPKDSGLLGHVPFHMVQGWGHAINVLTWWRRSLSWRKNAKLTHVSDVF